jgi:hypothetical protein
MPKGGLEPFEDQLRPLTTIAAAIKPRASQPFAKELVGGTVFR